ncbi:DMT family transporter [Hansschlegelia quercus]|uniref:DMT family transporter n=1 Tax=Hansschlegelia quercus TaxID=2528245 RepID=A0A4Q9GGX9_9HYPH|nr:DMT family transporter [Hansschlegelia quercus]TBN53399.1 DMT family transporter [Hansschlegelia quercus]
MLNLLVPASLAMAAGVSLVIQQVLNSDLRSDLGSAAWAGMVSYVGGLLCMALFVAVAREPIPSAAFMARAPWWTWTGGAFGAVYIVLAIWIVPQLGAATFIALLVAGQMLTSVAFDHFGVLGLAQRAIDPPRMIGIALLVAGVILIRR